MRIAANLGPAWLRTVLAVIGGGWVFLLGALKVLPPLTDAVPAIPRFFLQCSCLFPDAAPMRIDFRVEGFSCTLHRFVELDYRPYFPIHADDKESELDRLGHFYHDDADALAGLESYLVDAHDARAGASGDPGDGIAGPIGGIRFLSLRIPLPPVGAHVDPYRRMPLTEVPREERKVWYTTDPDVRHARCDAERL